MVLKVFLDIETLPPAEKDFAGAHSSDTADEEYRKLALNGDYGRLLTIGVIVEQDDHIIHRGVLCRERQNMLFHLDEARTLRGFWKLLRKFDTRRDLVIGHNVFDFDLLFVYKRSVIHGVRPSVNLSFARYRSQPVYDTMHEWQKWSPRKYISLDELARVLKLESSKSVEMNGSRVYDHFCAGCHEEIADYCLRDVELTRAIYRRLSFIGEGDFTPNADDK